VNPRAHYEERLQARRAEVARLTSRAERLSRARTLVFAAGVLTAIAVFDFGWLPRATFIVPVAIFVGLVVVHHRAREARRQAERAARFYESGLARLDHHWAGRGIPGDRFLDPHHPYAADLDLFGHGSLFELLCTARTQAGEETLARWLLAPAPPDEVRARQQAVAELRPRVDLREEMALLGEDIRGAIDPAALAAWATAATWQVPAAARVLAVLLPTVTMGAFGAWYAGWIGPWPMLIAGAVQFGFGAWMRDGVLTALRHANQPATHLALLAEILARLERERFESPALVTLQAALLSAGEPPSRRIARLQRLIDLLEAYRNQVFALLSLALLWRTNFALAVEAWRSVSGPAVPRWLAAIGELEALLALASHAFEHPADPFPTLVEGPPLVDGQGLGHPLLPESRCVRNDVRLDDRLRLLIVSGSNMSGKSTLLRTLGVSVVLAQAGAPVRAAALRLTPLAVGAAIRIVDSLQDGTSRFYAEVKRLGQIVELAHGPRPLLFLLDEILSGTNSHDRAIGAEAIVKTLVASGALGLVTTHDLALARIADTLGEQARNVHFEDHLEGGRMCFDYTMRPGVVTKSNALALMRAVGLEV
jgi:hypothetical protein